MSHQTPVVGAVPDGSRLGPDAAAAEPRSAAASGSSAGSARGLALGVVLAGSPGTDVPGWLADAIRDGLGGVILFAENTPDVATTRRLTDALRACRPAGAPLVVAVDEEGGDVTRLQARQGSSLPGNAALGVVDDLDLTRRCGAALGQLLAEAGVDLDLAPVLDVASDPRNPVVGTRSFGADAGLVARHGAALAQGLAQHVSVCGKHYPGHGATQVDSHLSLPVLAGSLATLEARDLAPFVALSRAGLLDAVMTGHLVVPALGPDPASLSRWATERIRAMGHDGAIITDALGMGAITGALGVGEHDGGEHRVGEHGGGEHQVGEHQVGEHGGGEHDGGEHSGGVHGRGGLGEACVRALEAGADLVCLDAPHQRDAQAALAEAVDAIERGLASQRLSPDELRRSAGRVARLARPRGADTHRRPGREDPARPDPARDDPARDDPARGDIERVDTGHGDTKHLDTEHGDTEHGDTKHLDTGHGDTGHGDTEHGDTEHGDTEHVDTEREARPRDDIAHNSGRDETASATAARDDIRHPRLEAAGLEAARRAVRMIGDTAQALSGPAVIVDVRARSSLAAGRTGSAYARVLGHSTSGTEPALLTPADPTQVKAALAETPEASEVVVLTRNPRGDVAERALLGAVLRARPRAVVVHTGVAATAPEGIDRLVLGFGAGLANARAVGELLGHSAPCATPPQEAR